MKYIAKMMLALLASVTLVIPAYAWDFSASGSVSSSFSMTTNKANKDDDANSTQHVESEGGTIALKSSHSDGDKSASLSFSVNYADGGLDQTLAVSGSNKVGKWTATGAVDYNLGFSAATAAQQTGEDAVVTTVTDGQMTIKLGDSGHLSDTSTVTGGVASGNVGAFGDGGNIGADVGGFQGVSLGYKMSDTMTATVAYQADVDAAIIGDMAVQDNEAGLTNGYQTTGFGANVVANVGANINFTFATGSAKPVNSNDNASVGGTSATTMGLGLTLAMGDMTPFFTFGNSSIAGEKSKVTVSETAMGLGLTMKMGSDSVVLSYTSSAQSTDNDGTATGASATGIEVGYNTTVGPATLGIGYGMTSAAANEDGSTWNDDGTARQDGYSDTDLEIEMSFSF